MMISSKSLLAAAVIVGLGAAARPANATPLLSFGQLGNTDTITAVNNVGNTTTTITGTAIPVNVTQYLGGGAPFGAILTLHLTSSGVITNTAGTLTQDYSGTASWTNGATNYLTATFTDTLFALSGATTLAITASQPPGSITFTSSILPASDFVNPLGLSFSFADATPPVAVVGTTLGAFVSTVSGTSSTTLPVPTPEPASLALLGTGVLGLGLVASRKRRVV
jgi:hypothetical protein